ncbi:MAG: hypothetical protein QM703_11565 [Gemmatales bacterium]
MTYLLHTSVDPTQEVLELHHLDLSSQIDTRVARYIHVPQTKVRPSLWRGSLSADSSLLVYQQDVLQPVITVTDAGSGNIISQIRWNEALSPLSVHMDPQNDLIAIPLGSWDVQYHYGTQLKLLVARLKTGQILGQYDLARSITHVRFQKQGLVLIDNSDRIGYLAIGTPTIDWKPISYDEQANQRRLFVENAQMAGFFIQKSPTEVGEFQLLDGEGGTKSFPVEPGFNPIGLRGDMLVSEKYVPRTLPGWLNVINERCNSFFGRYLVSPEMYEIRYQDTITGEVLTSHRFVRRAAWKYSSHRVSGATTLAEIAVGQDGLSVDFHEIFPFWTFNMVATLAVGLMLVASGIMRFRVGSKLANAIQPKSSDFGCRRELSALTSRS